MSEPPSDAAMVPTQLFSDFLKALCDSEGGEALHRMHTADAVVRHAEGVGPAAGIDPADFARAHRDISVHGGDRLPRFAEPLLALVMQAAATPLSDEMWRELGSMGVHGLLNSMLHEGMPEGFRALLGTADFGLWMLAV